MQDASSKLHWNYVDHQLKMYLRNPQIWSLTRETHTVTLSHLVLCTADSENCSLSM